MTIKVLQDVLANKIAAGEVVERPASVVKELIENSIDAQSTEINIELKEAGLERIRVTDNGKGMSPKDCERAFLRHATSKISSDRDLFHINTLGFRGEALASIAAVSKLTLQSSKGDSAGTLLTLEGGNIIDRKKSHARQGTEITVEELFYNTPARLKYMKTLHTELGHITDLLNRFAFAHPQIRFTVKHNGRTLFRTSGSNDLQQVISQVYGLNVAKRMFPVKKTALDFKMNGYVSKPDLTRASRNYITTIINGRYIRSPLLLNAIMRAYHTLLPIHRFPIVILNIQMDSILVDVNVHPTKLEVRFSKDRELREFVEHALYEQLSQRTLIPKMKSSSKKQQQTEQQSIDFSRKKITNTNKNLQQQPNDKDTFSIRETTDEQQQRNYNHQEMIEQQAKDTFETINQAEDLKASIKDRLPKMFPIGQLHGTYILAQNDEGLYMIDQHAAQERINYEKYLKKLAAPSDVHQSLLIPLTFEFTKSEAIFIEQFKEELKSIGLDFETFGNDTYLIRSYPNWFPKGLEEQTIRNFVDQIIKTGTVNIQDLREETAITLACKHSIKANEYLNINDMTYLLDELKQTENPFTCPHGRLIFIHYSTYEIEKMFKRIM